MWGLRIAGVALIGLVGGFLLGVVVSEVVAIVGHGATGGLPAWFRVLRYLPWTLAVLGLVGAPVLFHRARRS